MNEKELQNRLKSWPLWLAIAALAVFVGKTFFGVDFGDTVNTLMNLLLPIMVAFGIVNDPTNKSGV